MVYTKRYIMSKTNELDGEVKYSGRIDLKTFSHSFDLGELKQQNASLREQVRQLNQEKLNASRKYLPTLGELLDRLSIVQIKEVKIPDHKAEYAKEIAQMLHDIDQILSQGEIYFNAEMLRALVVLSQYNLHIWFNEANYRRGIKEGNDLELTHSLNGVRNTARNIIQSNVGGRKDYKVDCLAAEHTEWEPSWNERSKAPENTPTVG